MSKQHFSVIASLCSAFLISSSNCSAEVRMFLDRVPSAHEMAEILLKPSTPKSRSIHMNPKQHFSSDRIGLPIQFAFNSSMIKPGSKPYLNEMGILLKLEKMSKINIVLVGHTDASGSDFYNYRLSKQRATAVKNFLTYHFQIHPNRIKTLGQGENQPLPGSKPYDAINRRVEFYRVN